MKNLKLIFVALLIGSAAQAAPAPAQAPAPAKEVGDVMSDFDKLGGNEVLLEKAKALQPETQVTIVQDRLVKRNIRFEFMPEFIAVVGGDPYTETKGIGLSTQFHINPHLSFGVKYSQFGNKLSKEAENMISGTSNALGRAIVPDIDYASDQVLGVVNFYPFYGKMNVFNRIAHFDVYALLGGGNTTLASGAKRTLTGGGGVGFWITNHFTARWELRYQTYKSQLKTGEDLDMNLTVSSLQFGWLL